MAKFTVKRLLYSALILFFVMFLPPVSVVSPVRFNFSFPLKNETLIPIFRQPAQSESSWSLKSASDLPSTISPAFWKERSLPR